MEDYSQYYPRADGSRHPARTGRFISRRRNGVASLPYRLDRDGDAPMRDGAGSSSIAPLPRQSLPARGVDVVTRGGHVPRSRSQSLVSDQDRAGVFARLGPRIRAALPRLGVLSGRPRPVPRPNAEPWYKIRILEAVDVDREWLLRALQDNMSVSLKPVQMGMEGKAVSFFVNDQAAFRELRGLHKALSSPSGGKMSILVAPSPAPVNEVNEDLRQKMKFAMSQRYDVASMTLNLNRFHEDPTFKQAGISVLLSRTNTMKAVIELILANLPSLRNLDLSTNGIVQLSDLKPLCGILPLTHLNLSDNKIPRVSELERIVGFSALHSINLNRNPLIALFRDTPTYVEAVRRRLPQLQRLDDVDLPRKIGFDAPARTTLPLPVPVYVPQGEEAAKQLKTFVAQFVTCFDSNRLQLLEAYAEDAKFSLQIAKQTERSSAFSKFNRNLFNIHNTEQRINRLYLGRRVIVDLFATMPLTEHLLECFTMDVFLSQDSLVGFTVGGLLKEIVLANQTRRYNEWGFARNFVVKIVANGLQIISDDLTLTVPTAAQKAQLTASLHDASSKSHGAAFPLQSSTVAVLPHIDDGLKMAMVAQFSAESGMNENGSRRSSRGEFMGLPESRSSLSSAENREPNSGRVVYALRFCFQSVLVYYLVCISNVCCRHTFYVFNHSDSQSSIEPND